jgi:plastocyanin
MRDSKTLTDDEVDTGSRILWAACGTLVLAAVVLAGLFVTRAPGFTSLQTANIVSPTTGVGHKVPLTIVTNAGPQQDWPAFQPASFSIPAGQLVTITVENLDSATALPAALGSHAKVTGVVGDVETVVPIGGVRPYRVRGAARTMSAIKLGVVSHTFTIPSLGINVPISANSRTSFTILVPKAGQYSWLCFDPCGAGKTGFGTPMELNGYMAGTVTANAA